MALADAAAFIVAQTRLLAPPAVPEIRLHLADEAMDLWQRTEDELEAIGLPPPFWAFAWAGGQALARHLLDHPELVTGKRVLDFAAGSGIVAIAAMLTACLNVQIIKRSAICLLPYFLRTGAGIRRCLT